MYHVSGTADRPRGATADSDQGVTKPARCLVCGGMFPRPRSCKETTGAEHPCPTCGAGTPVTTDLSKRVRGPEPEQAAGN